MAWRIAQCFWHDTDQLNAYLRADWEPFAVTAGDDGATVWLRRSAEPADAGIADRPRGPRHEPEITR